jgi:uncharacterized protein (DUF488 family)
MLIQYSMKLYTIGHSNQTQDEFLNLLETHDIDFVVDVRSVPASNHNPQFNQDALSAFLQGHDITYLFMGNEFGARRMDSINTDGQVDFGLAIHTPLFQRGVDAIMQLPSDKKVALMCSEADPLECHRFSLIARYFYEHHVEVFHILRDASLASHQTLEQKMVNRYLRARKPMLSEVDELFGTYTKEQQLADAYKLKNKEIGFQLNQEEFLD